jgi:hypothetical protein
VGVVGKSFTANGTKETSEAKGLVIPRALALRGLGGRFSIVLKRRSIVLDFLSQPPQNSGNFRGKA